MFELQTKDAEAFLADFQQLMVSMTWTADVDFDLFAVYEAKDGRRGIVYYNDLGNMNAFPFMKLSGDAGADDDAKEESLVIVNLNEMKKVYLCCWDYKKVEQGVAGRFAGSGLKVSVMDDKGGRFEIPMVDNGAGNMARMATIDCSSPISTKLLNASKAGVLNGLNPAALVQFLEG